MRDLKTYAEFGRALWADPSRSTQLAVETLSAVSLLDLAEDRVMERASAALLDRAVKQGMASSTHDALGMGAFGGFFKLFPEERFVLVALHSGRWSYARLARVMGETSERIEALAWKARVRLVSNQGLNPIGGRVANASCPEYVMDRPWTQKFLDEEFKTGRETLFLQNHLMACDACRLSLTRCRDLYFAVEKMLPRVSEEDGILRQLESINSQGKKLRTNGNITFGRSIIAFLGQKDVQLVLGVLMFIALACWLRR